MANNETTDAPDLEARTSENMLSEIGSIVQDMDHHLIHIRSFALHTDQQEYNIRATAIAQHMLVLHDALRSLARDYATFIVPSGDK